MFVLSCVQAAGGSLRQGLHHRRHENKMMTTEVQESGILILSFQPQNLSVLVVLSNKMRGSDDSICGKNYITVRCSLEGCLMAAFCQ